ncbi:MAG: ABC transporter permease [Deltaproteobacteria bacterium]|jgi:NitT/TauT family transport system permease protein|nr:ABC transporter permease [Deltaproteobacteria bacterium]
MNRRDNLLRFLRLGLLGFALFNLLWFLLALLLDSRALPLPHQVYAVLPKALDAGLAGHFAASLRRVLIGLGVSLLIALLVGIPLGYRPRLGRLLSPLIYFSYPIPKLALLPVVMLLLGLGETAKIAVIVLILAFPMLLSVRDAVRGVPHEDYALLISLRATFYDKLRHIILPACLPAVLSSLRVSVGIAFSALFFTETFGTEKGLGLYITDAWARLDYLQMYFGIVTISFAGVIMFALIDLTERRLCRWRNNSFQDF